LRVLSSDSRYLYKTFVNS